LGIWAKTLFARTNAKARTVAEWIVDFEDMGALLVYGMVIFCGDQLINTDLCRPANSASRKLTRAAITDRGHAI
jgi:hypothetical protein